MVRIKHRYLVLQVLSPESPRTVGKPTVSTKPDLHSPIPALTFHLPLDFTTFQLFQTLKSQMRSLYGTHGLSLVTPSLKIIYLSAATGTAIVRVARDYYRMVWSALSFLSDMGGTGKGGHGREEEIVIRVIRVSGTIKGAEKEVIRRAKGEIWKARKDEETGVEGWLAGEEEEMSEVDAENGGEESES